MCYSLFVEDELLKISLKKSAVGKRKNLGLDLVLFLTLQTEKSECASLECKKEVVQC